MSHNELIRVYKDTKDFCYQNKKLLTRPQTVVYKGLLKNFEIKRPYERTEILVNDQDTLDCAFFLQQQGLKPLVLNMASDFNPGGGVEKGSTAQEESLFRRTDYFRHLNRKLVTYPLNTDQVVYTPNVTVIKDTLHKLLSTPFKVSFIACAGVRNPQVKQDGTLQSTDKYIIKQKIRMIFQTAVYHGHDSLVLGALGCGAFHNPPEEIVKIFNSVIQEYKGAFHTIAFAVLGGGKNYEVFSTHLSSK